MKIRELYELYKKPMSLRKKSTQSTVRSIIESKILPHLGDIDTSRLSTERLQEFVYMLSDRYSPATVSMTISCLSRMLRYGIALGKVRYDRTEGLVLPAVVYRGRVALSPEDVRRLVSELPGPPGLIVQLIANTGLRIGEVMGLWWEDINLSDEKKISNGAVIPPRSILVRRSWQIIRGRGTYGTLKGSKARTRVVPLNGAAIEALKCMGPQESGPVFAGHDGAPANHHNMLVRKIKKACEKVGIPPIGWHDLRHTAATWADLAGMSGGAMMRMFGWSSPAMIARYVHPDDSALRDVVEKMGT